MGERAVWLLSRLRAGSNELAGKGKETTLPRGEDLSA